MEPHLRPQALCKTEDITVVSSKAGQPFFFFHTRPPASEVVLAGMSLMVFCPSAPLCIHTHGPARMASHPHGVHGWAEWGTEQESNPVTM